MIWLNLRELETQLQKDTLPSRHVLIYFLIYVVLTNLSTQLSVNSYDDIWIRNITIIVSIAITVIFIIQLYQTCKAANLEQYFFKYYFSLGFVLGLRFVLFWFVAFLILDLLSLYSIKNQISLIEMILELGVHLVYFFMLLRSFNRVIEGKTKISTDVA
jgi:hypothetical protein